MAEISYGDKELGDWIACGIVRGKWLDVEDALGHFGTNHLPEEYVEELKRHIGSRVEVERIRMGMRKC
jgi:hypothetical protein